MILTSISLRRKEAYSGVPLEAICAALQRLPGGLPRVRPGLHALSVEEAEAKADRDGDIRSTVSNFDALGAHGRGRQRKLLVGLQAALPL